MERQKPLTPALILCTLILSFTPTAFARTIYVDDDAPPGGDGSSWQNAYTSLEDALQEGRAAEKPVEVRVAQGVYKPQERPGSKHGETIISPFMLFDGSVLVGGYAGLGTPDPNARDVNDYPTILSADLKGNDLPLLPGTAWERSSPDTVDNLTYVVRVIGANVTIDGFVITGGHYSVIYRGGGDGGAGLCLVATDARIANCTFMNNRTITGRGGAVYVGPGCHVEIVDSTFENNWGEGGGLFNFGGSVSLRRCVFTRNYSGSSGGALATLGGRVSAASCKFVSNSSGSPDWWSAGNGGAASAEWEGTLEFEDSLFIGNTAVVSGGAVFADMHHSALTFRNSLLMANVAGSTGGAIEGGNVQLTNCTITGNRATESPEISVSAAGASQLLNCIVWENEKLSQQDRTEADWLGTCSYCCIDPNARASRAIGNIDADPAFAKPGLWDPNGTPDDPNDDFWVDGDYHFKSQAGRWDPNSQSWVADAVTSPCIDAGDPNSPVGNEPQPNGGRINMGAYAGTAEASKSL